MQKKFSQKGFTLAELLLASAILAFTLTAILSVFVNGKFLNEANRDLTVAVRHAESTMEGVKAISPFANISVLIPPAVPRIWNTDAAFTALGLVRLSQEAITTTVRVIDATLLEITVTTTWNDRNARQRTVILRTRIANT